MLPILLSPRAFCFDDLEPGACDEVSMLETHECVDAWEAWGDTRARNLHELPKGHWLHDTVWRNIGNWITPYNGQATPDFIGAIEATSGWNSGQALFLIRDRKNIITLPWRAFSKSWRGLLCAFDDAPLLVPADLSAGSVICFAVLGHVQHAVRRPSTST
jgi:hypothetical protein